MEIVASRMKIDREKDAWLLHEQSYRVLQDLGRSDIGSTVISGLEEKAHDYGKEQPRSAEYGPCRRQRICAPPAACKGRDREVLGAEGGT